MPENQPRPGQFLNREQIQLLPNHAMVALLRLFHLLQVRVEIFLREKRSPVDALQLRILLIAQPVGASDIEQLERLDFPGRRNVRPAAEVSELAGAVNRNLFIGLGELLDEMALHEVAFFFELGQPLVPRQKLARVRQVLLHQFLHFLFDLLEILGRKRSGSVEVVKKTAFGRRPVTELGLRKQLEHRRRQQVRRRMPENLKRLGIFLSQETKISIFFQRPRQVDEIAVRFGRQRRIRQPRTDLLRNLERSRASRNFFHAPVRELHMNACLP